MSETLITSLSAPDPDVELIARDFAGEFADQQPQLLVALANVICSLCKVAAIPRRMIENGDLAAINAFLHRSLKPIAPRTRNTLKDLFPSKAWPNVPTFFHHLIYSEWDLLSAATKFDSFFNEFLNLLTTTAQSPALRFLSTAIQLEFTTVCSLEKAELLRNEHRAAVLEYTNAILRNAFHDCERKIWGYALQQMGQWFRHGALLLDNVLLRKLLWGLSDRVTVNSHACLQISLEMLDEHRERKAALAGFVQRFVGIVSPGLATNDMSFFEKLCELAVILHTHYAGVSRSEKYVDLVYQFAFAANRAKAKAAADVFVRAELRNLSESEQVHRIVQFLAPHNSVYVQLFVDAMIDEYPLLAEWRLLFDAMQELAENVEKEVLLLVIVCTVAELNGESPEIRTEKPGIRAADDFAVAVTAAFSPLLHTLSIEDASFRWNSLVLRLASYFDLGLFETSHKHKVAKLVVDICAENVSTELYDVVLLSTLFELFIKLLQHDPLENDLRALFRMQTGYENQFVTLEQKLRQPGPKDFIGLMNVVIGVYVCRSFTELNEKCMYDMPVRLLQLESTTDNVFLSFCHEVAIILSSDYVLQSLPKPDSGASLTTAQLDRIQMVFSAISDFLNLRFYSRSGELAFFALCRMAKTLFATAISEEQRDSIFTDVIVDSLSTYVALALGNIQMVQLSALELRRSSKESVVMHFCDLILADILPLTCGYEVLHAHCCQTSRVENELSQFLQGLVDRKFAQEVAAWIFSYFAEYFGIANENLLTDLVARGKRLNQLLQSIRDPMRNPMRDVMQRVHKLGVDLAVSRSSTSDGLSAIKFLAILVQFSSCLGLEGKKRCFEYFKQKKIVGDPSVAKVYFNSLRVGKRRSVMDDTESTTTEELDEPEARRFRPSHEGSDQSGEESEDSAVDSPDESSPARNTRSSSQSE